MYLISCAGRDSISAIGGPRQNDIKRLTIPAGMATARRQLLAAHSLREQLRIGEFCAVLQRVEAVD